MNYSFSLSAETLAIADLSFDEVVELADNLAGGSSVSVTGSGSISTTEIDWSVGGGVHPHPIYRPVHPIRFPIHPPIEIHLPIVIHPRPRPVHPPVYTH